VTAAPAVEGPEGLRAAFARCRSGLRRLLSPGQGIIPPQNAPVPGVAEHALGFRSIGEALALRDHLVRQVELPPLP